MFILVRAGGERRLCLMWKSQGVESNKQHRRRGGAGSVFGIRKNMLDSTACWDIWVGMFGVHVSKDCLYGGTPWVIWRYHLFANSFWGVGVVGFGYLSSYLISAVLGHLFLFLLPSLLGKKSKKGDQSFYQVFVFIILGGRRICLACCKVVCLVWPFVRIVSFLFSFPCFSFFLFSPFFCRDMAVLAYHLSHGPIGPFPLAVG